MTERLTTQGRPRKILGTPIQDTVDRMLDRGDTYKQIARATGVSVPTVGRYSIYRKSALAKIVDNEPSVVTVGARLLEVADDARELRRQTRVMGSPAGRARAISAETTLLVRLLDQLGITDSSVQTLFEDIETLIPVLVEFVREHPEQGRHLIDALAKKPNLKDLSESLSNQIGYRP